MIHAEPAGVRKKQPYQDDEAKYLREIKKISKPADQRRCFDISNCGGRNSHNHYSAEHHTCERYHSSSDKKQAETNSTVETRKHLTREKEYALREAFGRICSRRSFIKSLPRPERKKSGKSEPTTHRARRIATHRHACNSIRKNRMHDMIKR